MGLYQLPNLAVQVMYLGTGEMTLVGSHHELVLSQNSIYYLASISSHSNG